MNKKLYMEWLGNKIESNDPDGPITESRRRARSIDFYRSVIANLLDKEGSKSANVIEPYNLEPKSGIANFQQTDARQSVKIPAVEPLWSYRAKNTLGAALGSNSVYEATGASIKITPGSSVRAGAAAAKGLPKFKQRSGSNKVVVRGVAPKQTTALATVPKGGPLATIPKGGPLATVPKGGPLATVPKKTPIPSEPIPDQPIVTSPPPKPKPPTDEDPQKPSGASNPLGSSEINKRDKSKYTSSYHSKPRAGMTPFGIKPGSGEEYGGQTITESNLSTLVNHHVDKFLKTRQGKQLKHEASKLLTNKD